MMLLAGKLGQSWLAFFAHVLKPGQNADEASIGRIKSTEEKQLRLFFTIFGGMKK